MKRLVILLGLLVALVVGMTTFDVVQASRLRSAAVERCQIPDRKLEGEPYLTGKLAVIDVREGAWEPLVGGHLPGDLIPDRADDIGTCVFLEWAVRVDGPPQLQLNCKVTLVDIKQQAVIAEQLVFAKSGAGNKPVTEVEDFLFRLPRR